jgi:hypothetical protein
VHDSVYSRDDNALQRYSIPNTNENYLPVYGLNYPSYIRNFNRIQINSILENNFFSGIFFSIGDQPDFKSVSNFWQKWSAFSFGDFLKSILLCCSQNRVGLEYGLQSCHIKQNFYLMTDESVSLVWNKKKIKEYIL